MASMNLPTELLRSFVTVIDLGGYTKAGKALGRTQPAISLQIRRLEAAIGKKLITQNGRKLVLTEDGQVLTLYARQILRLNDAAVAKFRGSEAAGVLRIGLPTDYAVAFLQSRCTDFAAGHDEVTLEISCDLSQHLLEALHGDELDIVVAITGEGANQYLVRAWVESPIWVTAKSGGAERVTPVPLVAHPAGCEYRKRMVQALNQTRRTWRIAYQSPGISGLQSAVSGGLGVSALTWKTLGAEMRVLTAADGFPDLAPIRIGLFYKHANLSDAGLMLVHRLIASLEAVDHAGPESDFRAEA